MTRNSSNGRGSAARGLVNRRAVALAVLLVCLVGPGGARGDEYAFEVSRAEVTVIGPNQGVNVVEMAGPATVQVFFETTTGEAQDNDGNQLDEVVTEVSALNMSGMSDFGPVPLLLWAGSASVGVIEERVDGTTGTLDLPPFAAGGDADSHFNMFLETVLFGITVHNEVPARIDAVITAWPPPAGEIYLGVYDEPGIPLKGAGGLVTWGYLTRLELELQPPVHDYGDAPDPTYPTLAASNGAAHVGDGTLRLGTLWDWEADGQPTTDAAGDGVDDDGVAFTDSLALDVNPWTSALEVTASQAGLLDAWVDFNADGDWSDAGEQVFTSQAVVAGVNALSVTVPVDAVLGCTYARFRVSSAGGLSFDGVAADGEVEDYRVEIVPVADMDIFNKDLAGNQTFVAENSITIGGDLAIVPDTRILDGADILLHAGDTVLIKNGLQVEEGGALTIKVETVSGGCPSD